MNYNETNDDNAKTLNHALMASFLRDDVNKGKIEHDEATGLWAQFEHAYRNDDTLALGVFRLYTDTDLADAFELSKALNQLKELKVEATTATGKELI